MRQFFVIFSFLLCVYPHSKISFLLAIENTASTIIQSENISTTSDNEKIIQNLENNKNNNLETDNSDYLQSSLDVHASFDIKDNENGELFNNQIYTDTTSQNSGIANEVNNDQQVVVTLVDSATTELEQRAIISSQSEKVQIQSELNQTNSDNNNEIVTSQENLNDNIGSELNNKVLDETNKLSIKNENLTEEIPSFSEWAQKRLEEAEKNKEILNTSIQQQNLNGNKQNSNINKLRLKNYASLDCGAKIIASNPEAISPSSVLSPSRDEYKLNTCTSRIWFIVELCEAIQAKKIDLANFELFSSSPKDFTVSVSDRFPTRDWSNVGQFQAKDERNIQSFNLNPHLFGKYIKVEIKSHYGSEHYCPISLFRVYGTSEFEVLQKEDNGHDVLDDDDDDDDDDDESLDMESDDSSKNLFSSATDAVLSLVKKAAEVLGNKGNSSNQTIDNNINNNNNDSNNNNMNNTIIDQNLIDMCITPSHLIVCDNCSDIIFDDIYELLSCKNKQIYNLINIPLIKNGLIINSLCQSFGLGFTKFEKENYKLRQLIESFFSKKYLGAMCNLLAIENNKVVLNITYQYLNVTQTVTDKLHLINIETSEPEYVVITNKSNLTEEIDQEQIKKSLNNIELTDISTTKSTCSTDTSYLTQIKPTKAFTQEVSLKESNLPSSTTVQEESNVVIQTETVLSSSSSSDYVEKEVLQTDSVIENVENLSSDVEATTESVETLDDHLEHFISEFNGENQQNSPSAPIPTSSTPQAQKESVFLRLSNRIKVLERNMSLSGQYLEELSKRYKKQVEEMQKLFEKTLANLNEDGKKRDEYNKQLEERLLALTIVVETLVAERNILSSVIYFFVIVIVLVSFIYMFCIRNSGVKQSSDESVEKTPTIDRRKSIDVVSHLLPSKKVRRPSDQALKIVRSATVSGDESNIIKDYHNNKKKRKKSLMKRSNSINTLSEETVRNNSNFESNSLFNTSLTSSKVRKKSPIINNSTVDWIEDRNKFIEEVPFFLEESEHSPLEPLTVLPNDKKKKLESIPNYIKTALNSRRGRLSSSHNGTIYLNGNSDTNNKNLFTRKSLSVDETNRRISPVPSVNGTFSISSSLDEQPNITTKNTTKSRKSFRKMFKKVF